MTDRDANRCRGRSRRGTAWPNAFVRPLALVLCLAITGSCGTSSGTRTSGDADVITLDEIAELRERMSDAYQVVASVRPHWLRKRESRVPANEMQEEMAGDVVVYLDGVRIGGLDALRSISADRVAELRRLGAAAATRLGTGHQHGAILVVSM